MAPRRTLRRNRREAARGELGDDDLFRELPGKFPVPKLFAATAVRSAAATS